jgi:hypothetical protein
MTRIYPQVVGVPEYCAAIDQDCAHSPFVAVAKLIDPARLMAANAQDVRDLAEDGFFLIDGLGRLLDGASGTSAAYVIAPHVAQRERGGRCPNHFDRVKGATCDFGGPTAAALSWERAKAAIPVAWKAWKHGKITS